jgi:hypothetical protein
VRGRKALKALASKREAFVPLIAAQRGLRGNITMAVALEATQPGLTDLLRTLAVKGFAPIAKADPLAEKLCSLGIAGAVAYEDTVTSLPLDVWQQKKGGIYLAGLVPTSQMCRLLILEQLEARAARTALGK